MKPFDEDTNRALELYESTPSKTRIADNVWWHVNKQAREQEKLAKPRSRIDAKFEEWAKRNGINLKDIPVMEKKK